MRHPWRLALLIVAAIAVVAVVAIVFVSSRVSISSETARARMIAVLESQLDGEVELDDLQLKVLPRLRAEGRGLRIRHKGRHDVPPLISIEHFSAEGSFISLYRRHVSHLKVDGLDIEIPPDRNRGPGDTDKPGDADDPGDSGKPGDAGNHQGRRERSGAARAIVIDEMTSTNTRLVIIPKEPGKDPKVWTIHELRMHDLGVDQPMPFEATLTNAVPPGEIETKGSFGPWQAESPGLTPLDGTFVFDHADLGFFKGISGILSAHGKYGGTLNRIDVHGETDTPQFRVTASGNPVPLRTVYHAIVDGTNGNTFLDPVNGSFLNTSLVARGAVIGTPGKHGRTVTLDITMDRARLEDVLQLAVKSARPPMTGALHLTTKFVLPPGDREVVERLRLDGRFAIDGTRFTDPGVQTKINELSHRGQGKTPEDDRQHVSSQFKGTFKLGGGTLTIPTVTFDVPGSIVHLAGTYALVPQTIDFSGTLEMDATISQMTTGFKSKLLRIVDPIFERKGGGGTEIPIKINGVRTNPSFGVDKARLFKHRDGK
jgi:hypothetical protein